MAELAVTTKEGTTTVPLGHDNAITIDSPSGPKGTPAAEARHPHTFGPFRTGLGHPPGFRRVSGLKKSGNAIVVTEAGRPAAETPDPFGYPSGNETEDPWTEQTKVAIDDASVLHVTGHGDTRIPLAGLSAISLDEAA